MRQLDAETRRRAGQGLGILTVRQAVEVGVSSVGVGGEAQLGQVRQTIPVGVGRRPATFLEGADMTGAGLGAVPRHLGGAAWPGGVRHDGQAHGKVGLDLDRLLPAEGLGIDPLMPAGLTEPMK